MTDEILNINIQKINVLPATIQFPEFEAIKSQAHELATYIEKVEVSEENIQVSKKLLAAVNKRVKEMEDKRIAIKKELLTPYMEFEEKVKEIVSIVKDADTTVRNQVRELEEKERDEKQAIIAELFEKRMKQYSFSNMYSFENFLKPNHLNKTTSIKSIEADMVAWLEKIESDLTAISSLPNSDAILTEYYDTKDVAVAIKIVNKRESLKKQLTQTVKPTNQTTIHSYNITVFDEKDLIALEMFMQLKAIKYEIEKVAK